MTFFKFWNIGNGHALRWVPGFPASIILRKHWAKVSRVCIFHIQSTVGLESSSEVLLYFSHRAYVAHVSLWCHHAFAANVTFVIDKEWDRMPFTTSV
jgi:hypothetical protein